MITRVTALKDATVTGLATTCGVGTAYDLGAVEADQVAYGGMAILSTAAGANTILFKIFSASSSGAGFALGETVRFTFTAAACRNAQWGTPVVGAFATCQKFWRMQWATSCADRKALVWMARAGGGAATGG